MNDFDIALKYTLTFEGGYVIHPLDKGGPTNKGITQSVYDAYRLKHDLTTTSVRIISDKEVVQIYFENYWQHYKCDKFPAPLSIAMFDFCVNAGSNGIKKLQECIGVKADGVVGPNTLHAFYIPTGMHERINALVKLYQAKRKAYYYKIVALKPWKIVFLRGWIRRTNELSDLLLTVN